MSILKKLFGKFILCPLNCEEKVYCDKNYKNCDTCEEFKQSFIDDIKKE